MSMKIIIMITSPTTIFNGTPLYCTPCISVSWFQQNLFLSKSSEILDLDLTRPANAETNQAQETHQTTTLGGSKHFAHTALLVSSVYDPYFMNTPVILLVCDPNKFYLTGKFTLYFPYILLIAALVLTGIERFFNKIFKSNIQVNPQCFDFHNILSLKMAVDMCLEYEIIKID